MRIAIVGGGIAGLAAAHSVSRAGHEPVIFERGPATSSGGGAMLFWPNGLQALDALGVGDGVRSKATAIQRVDFRAADGRPLSTWHVGAGGPHVLFRSDLVAALRSVVSEFSVQCGSAVGCTIKASGAEVHFSDRPSVRADALIACDGIGSRLRTQLFGAQSASVVRQVAWQGTAAHADLDCIPQGVAIAFVGTGQRFCAARVNGSHVFWYATVNAARKPPGGGLDAVGAAFRGWHGPIEQLVAGTSADFTGPIALSELTPLRRWSRGRATLLGDAAHACLPDLGQGASQTLESAVTLEECLSTRLSVEEAFIAYEARRRPLVGTVMRTSRFVAEWSMSEAVHVRALRDLLLPHLLPALGFPAIERLTRAG
jgi:2-polyprenyl-6-methoxyphenol hydroxylase-like FAD-dependent oxidoreductase